MSFDVSFMACLFLKHHLLSAYSTFDWETNQLVLSSLHKKMSRVLVAVLHYPHAWVLLRDHLEDVIHFNIYKNNNCQMRNCEIENLFAILEQPFE